MAIAVKFKVSSMLRSGAARDKYGHMLVRRLLARQHFDPVFKGAPIIAQFSSLGSLSSAWINEFRDSLASGACASSASGSIAGDSSSMLPALNLLKGGQGM